MTELLKIVGAAWSLAAPIVLITIPFTVIWRLVIVPYIHRRQREKLMRLSKRERRKRGLQ